MRFMMLMIPAGYEKAGVLLSLDGLHPPSDGVRVTYAGGKPTVTHGPFPETIEALGGYWRIRVNSKDEAVEWASRIPVHHDAVVEIRQVFEMEEFPEDVQKAAGDFPERMKAVQR